MDTQPVILVTMSVAPANAERAVSERAMLNAPYIEAVQAAGGVPVLVPPQASPVTLDALVAMADGVMLTGGGDIAPARYGEVQHPATVGISDARDTTEISLIDRAMARELPLLAICRGMQILNVALGGTLCQDLPSLRPGAIEHAQTPAQQRAPATHGVRFDPGSRLAGVCGATRIEVNSMHHQAVERMGDGLVAVGRAEDGVIEAAEFPGRDILAVQWHPEELAGEHAHARALFAWLVSAAAARRQVALPA
jgi:putative glutamine amidotransferase